MLEMNENYGNSTNKDLQASKDDALYVPNNTVVTSDNDTSKEAGGQRLLCRTEYPSSIIWCLRVSKARRATTGLFQVVQKKHAPFQVTPRKNTTDSKVDTRNMKYFWLPNTLMFQSYTIFLFPCGLSQPHNDTKRKTRCVRVHWLRLPRNQTDISIDQELGKGLSVLQIIALLLRQHIQRHLRKSRKTRT